ncbi:MAG TPA: hypothetical protein DDZ67_01775 [Xanthomonadaceae bacterium]|nr:hypothetical protein [Xanthomonadaceae bacterium]
MSSRTLDHRPNQPAQNWLKGHYFLRFAVSAAWVALAFTVAGSVPPLAAAMLVAYPAWDAVANFVDARHNGGFGRNRSQLLNFVVSVATALAVGAALGRGMHAVLAVFGVWAALAGLLQLTTAIRRWTSSAAQWPMILSGAQSALAGVFFIKMANAAEPVGIATIAPYAAFGAFYFLVSAISLAVRDARRKAGRAAA